MHAAEKYLLGEMNDELRDQFEEHFFDCAECALDVQSAAVFIAASREVFSGESVPVPAAARSTGIRDDRKVRGWSRWLKPLIAIPAMAALVATTVYEGRKRAVPVPERIATASQNLIATADFGLRGGDRVESESTLVRVRQNDTIGLHFDFTPSERANAYWGEVQDEAGRVLLEIPIPAERINKEVKFVLPAGRLRPGNYVLLVFGEAVPKTAVAKYAFRIEMLP